MVAVWILGPLLAWLTGAYLDLWLQIKFVLVLILSGMPWPIWRLLEGFAAGPQHPLASVLSHPQRSSRPIDGR